MYDFIEPQFQWKQYWYLYMYFWVKTIKQINFTTCHVS